MIGAWFSFVLRWILAATLGTALLALGVPWIRINHVWRTMARADALMEAGRAEEASRRLVAVENWTLPYPAVCTTLRIELARALAAAGDLKGARAAAEAIFRDFGTRRLPRSILPWAFSVPAPVVEKILRASWDPGEIGRWSGFDALLCEMRERGHGPEAAALAGELMARGPDERMVRSLAAYALPTATPAAPPTRSAGQPAVQPVPPTQPTTVPPVENGDVSVPNGITRPGSPSAAPRSAAGWGIVKSTEARVYNMEGKPFRSVPEFFAVSVSETRESRSAALAVCSDPAGAITPSSFFIKAADLSVFDSPLSAVGEKARLLLEERSGLALRASDMKRRRDESLRALNPYTTEYDRAVAACSRYTREVEVLTKKRDQSTGNERMYAMDKLRLMIATGAELTKARDAARQKYEKWMAEQRARSSPQEVASLDRRMAEITGALREMGLP